MHVTANKMSGGQHLFGSNNLVVSGREQENWAPHYREINRASERRETAGCKLIVFIKPLNDLEIIGAGEIDGGVLCTQEVGRVSLQRRSGESRMGSACECGSEISFCLMAGVDLPHGPSEPPSQPQRVDNGAPPSSGLITRRTTRTLIKWFARASLKET